MKDKEKLIENILCIIFYIMLFGIIIFGLILFNNDATKIDENKISKCTNIKKFYKNDILFDNFYIACDEPINLEISPELYTRIVEGNNYIIKFNKLGGLYSIEKVEDE